MEKYKIDSQTIARTIILAIALINQIFAIFGRQEIPVNEDVIYQTVSVLFTLITTIWAWWKNNSFTPEAIQADKLMHELKAKRAQ